MTLGLGLDEMDEDEDEKIIVDGVPVLAGQDFLMKYGSSYEISRNAENKVILTPLEAEVPANASTCSSGSH